MRNETENKKMTPDRFSEYMRRRLADCRMPGEVPPWEALEKRLSRRIRRRQAVRRWWAVAAAALLALLLPSPEREQLPQEQRPLSVAEAPVVRPSAGPENAPFVASLRSEHRVKSVEGAGQTSALSAKEVMILPVRRTALPAAYPSLPSAKGAPKHEQVSEADRRLWLANAAGRQKRQEGWGITAALGTGGNVSLAMGEGSTHDPWNEPSVSPGGGGQLPGTHSPGTSTFPRRAPEDFARQRYLPPLSFGIRVRQMFSPCFGVEGGIAYTYLATRLSDEGAWGNLDLHYVGIPLNALFRVWNHSRWNLYLGMGGMAEKGIRSRYHYREEWQGTVRELSESRRIDGLQWSLNASFGISYRLYGGWNLYLEPRFSYYFDNRQPLSIRSGRPLGAGIAGGLRYDF